MVEGIGTQELFCGNFSVLYLCKKGLNTVPYRINNRFVHIATGFFKVKTPMDTTIDEKTRGKDENSIVWE